MTVHWYRVAVIVLVLAFWVLCWLALPPLFFWLVRQLEAQDHETQKAMTFVVVVIAGLESIRRSR